MWIHRNRYVVFLVALALVLMFCVGYANAETKVSVWVRGALEKDFDTVVDQFEAANPGVKVELTYMAGNVAANNNKILTAAAGGALPDVVGVDTWVAMQGVRDRLVDLTPYINKRSANYAFFPSLIESGRTTNDRLVIVPFWISLPMLFWNGDVFEANGMRADQGPETWSQFRDMAKKLTKRVDDKVTFWGAAGLWSSYSWLPALWSAGGDVVNNKGELLLKPGYEPGQWALELWRDLHLVDQSIMGRWQATLEGGAAMALTGLTMVPTHLRSGVTWQLQASLIPTREKGQHSPYLAGDGWAIGMDSKQPDLAWQFIDFVSRPDVQQKYMLTHAGSWVNGGSGVRQSYNTRLFTQFPIQTAVAQSLEAARQQQRILADVSLPISTLITNVTKGMAIENELEAFAAVSEAILAEAKQKKQKN